MQAQKLKQNKVKGRKGKIKKTIKHVVCRPDTAQWPLISDDERNSLKTVLELYKVRVPDFRKPLWNDMKLIPKSDRPKPQPVKRVSGLLFGITECKNAIKNGQCCSVLIEASVNPRTIVQPVIEKCLSANIAVLCVENLRKLTEMYFGIKTSCLSIKNDSLSDLSSEIKEIFEYYKTKMQIITVEKCKEITTNSETVECMSVDEKINETNNIVDPYLYRTNKKTRVFDPSGSTISSRETKEFSGQHFIKVNKIKDDGKVTNGVAYMRMVLKKINGNPNRVKTQQ